MKNHSLRGNKTFPQQAAKPLSTAGTRALKLGITPVLCLLANPSSWVVRDLHSAGLMDR